MLSPIALDDDNTSSSRPIPIPARARPLHLHPIVIGGQEQPMSLSDRQYYRWSVPHWQAYDPASAAPFSSSSSSSSSPHLPPPLTCDASPSSSSWAPFHTLHKQSVHDLFLPHPVLPISKLDCKRRLIELCPFSLSVSYAHTLHDSPAFAVRGVVFVRIHERISALPTAAPCCLRHPPCGTQTASLPPLPHLSPIRPARRRPGPLTPAVHPSSTRHHSVIIINNRILVS
jgi:hypothetical protein